MSFKLLIISSVYPEYLESFYKRDNDLKHLSYDDHYNLLISDATDIVGSYTRTFQKLDIEVKSIIANDRILQNKWKSENCNYHVSDRNIIFEQIKKFQPEVLSIENLNFTDRELLINLRNNIKSIRLIFANYCCPYGSRIIDRLNLVDFVITCTPGLREEFEFQGIPSYLVYHGFDKELLVRINEEINVEKRNFVFSGSLFTGEHYHGNRIEFIERLLKEDINIELYLNLENKYRIKAKRSLKRFSNFLKIMNINILDYYFSFFKSDEMHFNDFTNELIKRNHKPLFGMDMYKLIHGSKIVLNNHIGIAGNYAGNMRLFETTGLGSCLLTDNKRNLNELFDTNTEIVVYDNIEDCVAKVRWLIEHEEERKQIAHSGQQRTLKCHSIEARCKSIIEIVKKELKTKILYPI